MMELTRVKFIRLVSIVNRAKIEWKRKQYDSALQFLQEALGVYPYPFEEWVGTEHLCVLMGDVFFELQKYEEARDWFSKSKLCIDKTQQMETDFKIGKTYYEAGNLDMAKKTFNSIFSLSGKKLFMKEKAVYYHIIAN